ncbi:MAG: hypothetical protein ACI9DH_001027 [Halioglobus sp.]|jgi:hypothetical protein
MALVYSNYKKTGYLAFYITKQTEYTTSNLANMRDF